MTSCTIIISHYHSLPFLRACIRQIKKYIHPEINQRIIIVDQSESDFFNEILNEYGLDYDIIVVHTKPLYSGYGIDFVMRIIAVQSDFICQLHVDAFPIHPNWLYLPIKLIEENNFSFVGQLHFISKPTDTIYPPGNPFFSMSPTFNVARTETYREMALEAGFTRFHNRPQSVLEFKNNDWNEWASADYHARGSDDDTIAFAWESNYKDTDKLGLAISNYIAPNFGRIIDGLVFHFCSCREAIGTMSTMPELYKYYTKRINENYNDELIQEMLDLAHTNKPPELEILSRNYWDGKLKKSSPTSKELNNRIEELKII